MKKDKKHRQRFGPISTGAWEEAIDQYDPYLEKLLQLHNPLEDPIDNIDKIKQIPQQKDSY